MTRVHAFSGPRRFAGGLRLWAVLAATAVLGGCFDGGSDPPETRLEDSPPVANAGPDATAIVGQPESLDGSASADPDGDRITYAWTFESRPAGSGASLVNASSATPSFTPDVPGSYVVRLTVSQELLANQPSSSDTDTVAITADPPDPVPPVANAGADQSVTFSAPGVTVDLDGSGSSDPLNAPLTYAWEIAGFVPAGGVPPVQDVVLSGANTATPSFDVTAADQLGVYTIELTVNNGTFNDTDTVQVTLASIPAPIANAGLDQEVTFVVDGVTVSLDGSASSDPSSLPLTYTWQILSFDAESGNPPASLPTIVGADTATPTFDVTELDQLGTYTIQLTVNNGTLFATDTVVVTVAKIFPATGALLGSGLLGVAGAALRRRWRRLRGEQVN